MKNPTKPAEATKKIKTFYDFDEPPIIKPKIKTTKALTMILLKLKSKLQGTGR